MPVCPTCSEKAAPGALVCPHDGTPLEPSSHAKSDPHAATVMGSEPAPAPAPAEPRKGTQAIGGADVAPAPARSAAPAEAAQPPVSGGAAKLNAYNAYKSNDLAKIIPGTMVGEYEVAYKLGEGGMGKVYAAVHPIIGKRVAVKILSDHVASNRDVVRRFVAEARAVNQIGHRNIVDVFAFGQLDDGREYYVMEHLVGRSLQEEIDAVGRMEASDIVEFMVPTLDALQAAHDAGIIHRDLKPDNIFLVGEPDGKREVRLLDFGIAKLSGEESALTRTRTGVAMGTPDFMSPEQCRGANVDHRTDIYAIGMILYEMFTGALPFKGSATMELFFKQINDPPPPPSTIVPISREFEQIIMTCISKEPEDRYQSSLALAQALKAAFKEPGEVVTTTAMHGGVADPIEASDTTAESSEDEAPSAGPAPTAEVVAPPAPSSSGPGMMIALAAVVAVAGGLGAYVLLKGGGSPDAPAPPPVAVTAPADAAPQPPVVVTPDAAAVVELGSLVVKTNVDGAEVFVDEKPVGKGKRVEVKDLAPGSYLVEVRRKRYKTITRPVQVAGGAETSEAFVLERRSKGSTDSGDTTDDGDKPDPLGDKDGTIDVFKKKKKKPQ